MGYAQAQLSWTRVGAPPPAPIATATVTSATLNVRQGPASHYPILTTITRGTVVQLAGYRNASGTWVTITTPSGTTGWAYSPLLATTYPIMSLPVWTEDGGGLQGPFGIVAGARYLNVRGAPNMSATILTTVRGGTVLELIGRDASGYWLKVITPGGTLGWVGSRYIQTDYAVETLPVLTQ